jgi:type VI secretion system secreted protein VgrG
MATPTQAERLAKLKTPLGEDHLLLVRFHGTEHMSELFEYTVEALSVDRDVDFDGAIGRNCSVTLEVYGTQRTFDGILVEAQWLGPRNDFFAYRLVLRPWYWLLSRTTDCRIFEKKTVVEIIKQVFADRGFNDFDDKTTQSYPQIEYCVQYRESDLAFTSRLMEQYGIYYFFDQTGDRHKLIMADSRSSHHPAPDLATLPYIGLDGSDRRAVQHVHEWTADRKFRTGKVELKDYDFIKPNAKLLSDAKGNAGYAKADMEFYDYPGLYFDQDKGDRFAKVQLEAEQALDQRRFALGHAPSLAPGGLTTVEDQVKPSENIQYLVLGATHEIVNEDYRSGGSSQPAQAYQGSYEFLPSDRPFRALLKTPRPHIHGIQTAKVVGKSGEEIDVDEYGRILVQFYWDRKKMQSCRVRVAQVWAGKNWGGIYTPRIGMEVVVEYLEGNPDRPLVTGCVYNDDNKVPWDLPSNKTQSGWKTDSSKGHGGYNQIMFEDKKGAEDIQVHAQKDLDTTVLNKQTETIGENFLPPMGSPSRDVTLKNGDDNLTLEMGNQQVNINLGSQTTTVMQAITTSSMMSITDSVIISSIDINPGAISITAPVINLTGMATINLTAPIINITGVVNLTGMLNITGGLLVNSMVPMLLPA